MSEDMLTVAGKRTRSVKKPEPQREPLASISITLPREVIAAIHAEAARNYPITPSQIVRRIVVAHFQKLQALLPKS